MPSCKTEDPAIGAVLAWFSVAGWLLLPPRCEGLDTGILCLAALSPSFGEGYARLSYAMSELSPPALAWHWAMMLLAMMPPLLLQPISHLAKALEPRRRAVGVALFAAAYAAVWMMAGALLIPGAAALWALAGTLGMSPLASGLSLAALWQATPLKRASLGLCRHPFTGAPRWTAACLRHGLIAAFGCVGACWAAMLVPFALQGDSRPLMAAITLLLLSERLFSLVPKIATE